MISLYVKGSQADLLPGWSKSVNATMSKVKRLCNFLPHS